MSKQYTKDQCLEWIKDPVHNPVTKKSIQINKGVFKDLLSSCKNQLSPEEVFSVNPDMTKILFPTFKIPLTAKPDQTQISQTDQPMIDQTQADKISTPKVPIKLIEPAKPIKSKPKTIQSEKPIESTQKLISFMEAPKGDLSLEKNTFKIPDEVNFKVQKLTEKNKQILSNKTTQKLVTEEELLTFIKDDNFIKKLLESEKKLLSYKKVQYNKIIKQTTDALEDPLLKAAGPPDPHDPQGNVVGALNIKLKVLKSSLEVIDTRLKDLGASPFTQLLINDKRKKINNILTDPENGTQTLIGEAREEIRKSLYTKIVSFSKAPELYINRFNNFTLMGGAGTGKTKLAGVLGNFFYNLGLLNTKKVIIVTRADLVGKYIGETAPITRKYLESTLEGVLFIDEAYQLSGCPDQQGNFTSIDFGSESITEIVNYIDKHIGLSVIIGAGYEDKINNCFLKINEGMKRRFPNNLRLLDYSSKDLSSILYYNIKKMFGKQILTSSQIQHIDRVIKKLNEMNVPGINKLFINQAGDMLNLSNEIVQDLILNQKKGYKAENINITFTKFFINKGLQVLIK